MFISYIRIIIISCNYLCYLHGSDFIDLGVRNIILVLFIFVDSFKYLSTICFLVWNPQASAPITSGTHKDFVFWF